MAALTKAASKTAADIGAALAKKKTVKVDELASPANSRTNGLEYQSAMSRNLSPAELNKKYNVQPSAEYKAYQDEVAATRAGTTTTKSPAPNTSSLTAAKTEPPIVTKTEAPKAQGGATGTKATTAKTTTTAKSAVSSGLKTVGIAGLMGAGLVGIPALIEGAATLSTDQTGESSSGGGIIGWFKGIFGGDTQPTIATGDGTTEPIDGTLPGWEYLPGESEGETAYIGGGGYYGEEGTTEGESGISSLFAEAADFISNNIPLIIGAIAVVVIAVLASKSGKTSKPPVKRTAQKKTGGSRA